MVEFVLEIFYGVLEMICFSMHEDRTDSEKKGPILSALRCLAIVGIIGFGVIGLVCLAFH